MVEIENLKKIYKLNAKQIKKEKLKSNIKVAVDGVSFKAQKGEIFGILGPNGAGKTTILRCLSTLLIPTEGKITVDGFDTVKEPDKVRGKLGFLTNDIKLDPQFSADYLYDFMSRLHKVDEDVMRERKKMLFSKFGIEEFKDKKIEELSTGMKQKAAIAVCLAHDPEIVIFDEPTNGLDIITARLVTDYLKELRDNGKLVIVSTHIMSEAEKICDRVAIIIDGHKICESDLEGVKREYNADNLEDAFFEMYKLNHREE